MVEVWIVLGVISTIFQETLGESISACFNSTQKSLQIQCGAGYMLKISRSFYGYSESNSCSYNLGDCIHVEQEKYPCVGRDSCNINLPSGNYGRTIPSCQKDSNYFQVEYECVLESKTHDICQTPAPALLTEQRGYIATPRYPNNYRNNLNCLTTIRVSRTQTIKLYIIDMDLESNGTFGCHDWMYVHDKLRSVTLCGRRGNEPLTKTNLQNEITVHFQSNNGNKYGTEKGFWLYYEAFPYIPQPTTPHKVTTPSGNGEPNNQKPSTAKIPLPSQGAPQEKPATIQVTRTMTHLNIHKEKELPFAAIVGGVIGTLSVILLVLLVLLAVKWWKERRAFREKDQFLEIRNPAFRNSNEFQGVEVYYNC